MGVKRVTKKVIENVERQLQGEVEIYNQYLRGDVYEFVLEDKDKNHIDSVCGFYGSDVKTNGILDHISITR